MSRCTLCGFDNAPGTAACAACGAALERTCGVCGEKNPARFRFCGACGSPLPDPESGPAQAATGGPPRRERRRARDRGVAEEEAAERRHLTVMFCDLVGSSILSVQLDPEELREVVRSYQRECAAVIERFGGYIAQYLGDGVLAYFGFPIAHEDEAQRAIRAGLDILRAMKALNQRLAHAYEVQLAVRIGIHTGVVVVGEVGGGARRERLALGDAPNVAARLQTLAPPDGVVVSSDTHRLAGRGFHFEPLSLEPAAKVGAIETIYRVLDAERAGLPQRDESEQDRPPLVGRDAELAVLLERWRRVVNGEGQVVCIGGDPGIGKSHLVEELRFRVRATPHRYLSCVCLPYFRNSAFQPVAELIRRQLDDDVDKPPERRRAALAARLEKQGIASDDALPLLAGLLGIPAAADPPALSPQVKKSKTLALLLRILERQAAEDPLILLVEDVHWADPSTLQLLDLLIPRVAGLPVLLVLTFRPEFATRWPIEPHVVQFVLRRIDEADVERLIAAVAGGGLLPADVRRQIAQRTDGVPLFIEELTKMVLESGMLEERDGRYELKGPLPSLAIPTTLRDSLEARLERLVTVKELAQLCATLGRDFTYALVRAVATPPDAVLQEALAHLVEAGLLQQRGEPPRASYSFKHGLIQEAAYESLLRSARQKHHERIAAVLESRFPDVAESQPELVAHHYTAAGRTEQAVRGWKAAGRRALERSANAEAAAHLRQGLELLQALPQGTARARHELELLALLGPALIATRGYAAHEVREVYTRAHALCRSAGDAPELHQILTGLFSYSLVRADFRMAANLAAQMLEQARDDQAMLLTANVALAVVSLMTGSLPEASRRFKYVIDGYRPDEHAALAVVYGQDVGVVAHAYSALLLWVQGFPESALQRIRAALELSERIAHPHSQALALSMACSLAQLRRDAAAVRDLADAVLELATTHGFEQWIVDARFFRAWALAHLGRAGDALASARLALEAAGGIHRDVYHPYYRIVLAELYATVGRPGDALPLIESAVRRLGERDEHWWCEAELHRVLGELLLATGATAEQAERELRRALELARARLSPALELRAALSLARLWAARGRTAEAHALLQESHESFVEGFDTGDLRAAAALLSELESGAAL